MPLSTNIHSYADVAGVLASALPSGFATYRLPTEGAAVHWMMRANRYRLLLQKAEAAKSGIKGFQPPTPYDRMKLVRKGNAVEIDFNPQPVGELSLPSGKVVKPTSLEERIEVKAAEPPPKVELTPRTASLDLQAIADQLAQDLGDE